MLLLQGGWLEGGTVLPLTSQESLIKYIGRLCAIWLRGPGEEDSKGHVSSSPLLPKPGCQWFTGRNSLDPGNLHYL